MSYLAGCLLLHLETEFETFKAFANLMNKEESLFHFYSFSMDKVNVVYHIFMRILKEKSPKLFSYKSGQTGSDLMDRFIPCRMKENLQAKFEAVSITNEHNEDE